VRQRFGGRALRHEIVGQRGDVADDALQVIREAGVRHIWSTDCIAHESNVVSIAALLAEALQ
jgi:hypothetical protein